MATSKAKENILKRIRQALSHPVPLPFPQSEGTQSVFHQPADDSTVVFAETFTKLQGRFAYCANVAEMKIQLSVLFRNRPWSKYYFTDPEIVKLLEDSFPVYTDLPSCDVAITTCEYLSARTGTIVLSATQHKGRTSSVYAPVHVCIAYTSQLRHDIKDVFTSLKEKHGNDFPSFVTFATGPSRTADIEKTLVTGVHGPKEVYCFLVEDLETL